MFVMVTAFNLMFSPPSVVDTRMFHNPGVVFAGIVAVPWIVLAETDVSVVGIRPVDSFLNSTIVPPDWKLAPTIVKVVVELRYIVFGVIDVIVGEESESFPKNHAPPVGLPDDKSVDLTVTGVVSDVVLAEKFTAIPTA
jgi:hypothetical protein